VQVDVARGVEHKLALLQTLTTGAGAERATAGVWTSSLILFEIVMALLGH